MFRFPLIIWDRIWLYVRFVYSKNTLWFFLFVSFVLFMYVHTYLINLQQNNQKFNTITFIYSNKDPSSRHNFHDLSQVPLLNVLCVCILPLSYRVIHSPV